MRPHFAPTRLSPWRTPTTTAAGSVLRHESVLAVRRFCDRHGLVLHLDGARVCNAVVASGCLRRRSRRRSTRKLCCRRPGAPVGSLLVEVADSSGAPPARKLLGAACGRRHHRRAGLYALQHNVDRLADDTAGAGARGAHRARPRVRVDVEKVETNIVFADTRGSGCVRSRW